jgi:predicted RNase H-like HicB family nuclease
VHCRQDYSRGVPAKFLGNPQSPFAHVLRRRPVEASLTYFQDDRMAPAQGTTKATSCLTRLRSAAKIAKTSKACYRGSAEMKPIDEYHRWVEWSDEDQVYIGKCPDLITGIHGDDPVEVYKELGEVVQEVIDHFQQTARELPAARTRPMMEVS